MSEVGLSIAVTKDSRDFPGGQQMAENMLREAMSRRFPAATDLEIHWLWDEASGFIDDEGDPIPPYWLVMITGQTPVPPEGWRLIAPIDAVPGDGVLLPDGTVTVLDARMFDVFPVDVRRNSWAVRR